MALSVSDLVRPSGSLPTDLIPRTPDEVEAHDESPGADTYASDTDKTRTFLAAFLLAAEADARVTALSTEALQDAAARLYAEWQAWEARADALMLTPRTGSADGEGSYSYDVAQVTAVRLRASDKERRFLAAVDDATDDTPRARRSAVVARTIRW